MNDFLEQYNKEFGHSWKSDGCVLHATFAGENFTMYLDPAEFDPEWIEETEIPKSFKKWKENLQKIESWDDDSEVGRDITYFCNDCAEIIEDEKLKNLKKENEELKQEIDRLKGKMK